MHLVSFFLLFNCLSFSISKNIVLIITDDQDSILDGMVASLILFKLVNKIKINKINKNSI